MGKVQIKYLRKIGISKNKELEFILSVGPGGNLGACKD